MKIKLLLLIASVMLGVNSQAFAVTTQTQVTQAKLNQLERQINSLQKQVYALKRQNNVRRVAKRRIHTTKHPVGSKKCRIIKHMHSQFFAFTDSVIIAPFTERETFNTGNELIVNAPAINEDVKLLYRRYLERHAMTPQDLAVPMHPRLLLSGKVQAKAVYEKPYVGSRSSDIDLSWAELDAFAEISTWVNGFIAMTYDNTVGATPNRISNSNIKLDRGFLLFGNFNRSHWYGSAGQVYVPFGRYGSNMISNPLTYYIGKTQARAITVGYAPGCNPHSLYGSVFIFQGASKYYNSNNINNGGIDLGFVSGKGKLSVEGGVSCIYNIADAAGMQNNGVMATTGNFRGFDASMNERIRRNVPGGDVHGVVSYGPFSVIGEYVSALRNFNPANLRYNGRGAKPSAFDVQGAYVFHAFTHPSSVAIGYSASRQALVLNIPKQRYYASVGVTVLNNTKATLEFRHDKNYGVTDTATGQGMTAFVANQRGKTDNAVTAQLTVYF
jgi:hypothetical protein